MKKEYVRIPKLKTRLKNHSLLPIWDEKRVYYKMPEMRRLKQFISKALQINLIIKTKPKNILEIGIGDKETSDYLKKYGFKVTTCDYNEELKPDFIADIRELPFKDNSFDTVACFEMLEHLPYEYFDVCLKELKRVSRKNVIISFPYSSWYIRNWIQFRAPLFQKRI